MYEDKYVNKYHVCFPIQGNNDSTYLCANYNGNVTFITALYDGTQLIVSSVCSFIFFGVVLVSISLYLTQS